MSNIQSITEQFKGLSAEELLTIIAAATAEAKKSVKLVSKAPKEAKEKKGSMPKGEVPPQLVKPRAWVNYTLNHANNFGWESFEVKGQTEPMAASVLVDGKNVFEATGKPMNNKQAMSLSKQYWSRKEAVGSNKELYDEFEAQYVPPKPAAPKEAAEESDAESEASEVSVESAPKEKKAKKAKKTEEEKEAEKVAKKEAAALKKAQDKEAKETAKKEAAALKKAEEAPKPKPVAMKLKKVAPKVEELPFDIEADGMAHEWVLQGKKVYTDSEGNMWERCDNGEAGRWMGKYDPSTKVLDKTAEEPEHDEE